MFCSTLYFKNVTTIDKKHKLSKIYMFILKMYFLEKNYKISVVQMNCAFFQWKAKSWTPWGQKTWYMWLRQCFKVHERSCGFRSCGAKPSQKSKIFSFYVVTCISTISISFKTKFTFHLNFLEYYIPLCKAVPAI